MERVRISWFSAGLLHTLLDLNDREHLERHPRWARHGKGSSSRP